MDEMDGGGARRVSECGRVLCVLRVGVEREFWLACVCCGLAHVHALPLSTFPCIRRWSVSMPYGLKKGGGKAAG